MSQEDELYFFSGGGSGGHVTPLVAVAEELKKDVRRLEFMPWFTEVIVAVLTG